jgi:hypothetical protein
MRALVIRASAFARAGINDHCSACMSYMHALVPDVVAVLQEKAARGEGFCVRDASFGAGAYTGQRGTSAGRVVRHGYGRMDFENGDWYQGQWCTDDMHGTGCFYHKKTNFGYQGAFDKNCSVLGTYYLGSLANSQCAVHGKAAVHVLRERSWEAVNVLQDTFWDSVYKL